MIPFNPLRENVRAGLTLVNGQVYIEWASHGDILPYHGWVMSYDAKTLKQTSVFNSAPNGIRGSIWQGGGAPASDGTNLFVAVGNGTFDASAGGNDYGVSILKLTPDLKVADSFTPANQFDRIVKDIDTGQLVERCNDLNNGDKVNLSALGIRNVSVVAYAAAGPHGATDGLFSSPVTFDLDGSYTHVEKRAPYALFGDFNNGQSYYGRALAAGTHAVSASVDGAAYSVAFDIV